MVDLDLVYIQPLGSISQWSGDIVDIPRGWQLCDGTNGTPDLVATFVRGAPAATEAGGIGGEDTHTLSVAEMPNHTHSTFATGGGFHFHRASSESDQRNRTFDTDARATSSSASGAYTANGFTSATNRWLINTTGGASHQNLPAYFELAFIQRLQ